MDEGKMKIDRFDGKDFGFQKNQIEDLLHQKNKHQPLLGEKPKFQWRKRQKIVRSASPRCDSSHVGVKRHLHYRRRDDSVGFDEGFGCVQEHFEGKSMAKCKGL